MSLQKSMIHTIANAIGIPSDQISDEIAQSLASDAEYRMREIIQDAAKFMKHGKRNVLKCEDVNYALAMKNVQPLYGYKTSSQTVPRFHLVNKTQDLYFLEDAEIELKKDHLQVELPRIPLGAVVNAHWLAIQGVQPKIPQNPTIVPSQQQQQQQTSSSALSSDQQQQQAMLGGDQLQHDRISGGNALETNIVVSSLTSDNSSIQVKKQVKHVLSSELVLYYEKATEAIKSTEKNSKLLLDATYKSLSEDPGLGNLVPYLIRFVSEECTQNLNHLLLLERLMRTIQCLLINPNLHIELYLHQIMPIVLTCLVGKRLCKNPTEDHWRLRDYSAYIIAYICNKFGANYHTLQPRVTKALLHAFLDPTRPRTTHYGAIVGIGALGPAVTQLLLMEPVQNSNVAAFCRLLEPELRSTNHIVRFEAQMCYGALLEACSSFFVRLSRFFTPVHDDAMKSLYDTASTSRRAEASEEDMENRMQDDEQDMISLEKYKTAELTRDLRERMNAANIPADINLRYQELYMIFGESILPYISYDIMSILKEATSVAQLPTTSEDYALASTLSGNGAAFSHEYQSMSVKDIFL